MVAITAPSPVHRPAARPVGDRRRLHAVPAGPASATAPSSLGRLAGLVAIVLVVLASLAYLATSAPTTPGAAGAAATLEQHVVTEGETMWSIAQEIAPAGEAATYVERLVEANGGASIDPGQVLTVPVP